MLMRKNLFLALTLVLCAGTTAHAGVPDPARSGVGLTGQVLPCQYRFRLDGSLDALGVRVTLRDAFDTPFPNCSTSVTLKTKAGTLALCGCCPNRQGGVTNSLGIVNFPGWRKLGGRGLLDVCVTAHCQGNIAIGCTEIRFTSTDLDADCIDTDVVDIALWAGCLPPNPYCVPSDYNCDNTINTLDLALWAGGLGLSCAHGPPCP
jgi:hypothetical protein